METSSTQDQGKKTEFRYRDSERKPVQTEHTINKQPPDSPFYTSPATPTQPPLTTQYLTPPFPIGPAIPYQTRHGIYKYHALPSPFTLQAFEDGPDRGFRNVGQYKTDAGETPKS
jgi:hypothetical protein